MRRLRRLGWAGLISLALHALIFGLLWALDPHPSPNGRTARLREKAVEVEIITLSPSVTPAIQPPPVREPATPPSGIAAREPPKRAPPPVATREAPEPAPPPVKPSAPTKDVPTEPPPATATREPSEPPPPPVATREPAPSEDAPRATADDLPRLDIATRAPAPAGDRPPGSLPSNLLPSPGSSTGIIITTPENSRGGGRTLRPGDPSLSAEALAAEEHARVSERVQGIVDERRARDRVDTGRIHPYFGQLRAQLEKQMDAPPLFDMPSFPKQLLYSYAEKARQFGASGSPGAMPGPRKPPKPGELLAKRARDEPGYNRLRGLSQAGEELQDFAHGVSTLKLTVTLELLQGPDGLLREVKLISRSGNRAYDDYVLQAVPPALGKSAPPPPDAMGVHTDGIRSVWAVEGRVVYVRKVSEMKKGSDNIYLAALTAAGLLAGNFDETTGEVYIIDVRNPHFECRSRLLRVY
ncbi:TonB C-terminal domain-containing protein [Corallococcus sp. CA049B]|uniref:TonB C-terminal domain-containing protein n=1 Tax=Corallococcus sp. CA049B TaxID=2316730 RepID=UPI001F2835C3|nr:TonB C-terminal domain-containing protein [Corallococcus sp. CA049B]